MALEWVYTQLLQDLAQHVRLAKSGDIRSTYAAQEVSARLIEIGFHHFSQETFQAAQDFLEPRGLWIRSASVPV